MYNIILKADITIDEIDRYLRENKSIGSFMIDEITEEESLKITKLLRGK